jgi:quercetin dioxygenase-like cupin family protein
MIHLALLGAAMAMQPSAAPLPPARPPGTARTDLQRHDLSISGWETVQVRVDFAPGASFPMHTHPGEEIIYVTDGVLEYVVGGKTVRAKAGEVLFVPYGVPHSARNPGTVAAAELATYVLRKGKPLVTLVP